MIFDVNTASTLSCQSVVATGGQTALPPPVSITLPKPVSYQFQVVEYTDKEDKIVKVELQVQQTEHDNYGNTIYSSGFKPVPRIKLPLP